MTQCKLRPIFTWTVAFGSMTTSGLILNALIRQSKIFTWILGRREEKVMYFQQEFLPFISMSNVGVTNLKKTRKPWRQKLIILICTLTSLARIWHLIKILLVWVLAGILFKDFMIKKNRMESTYVLIQWFFIYERTYNLNN